MFGGGYADPSEVPGVEDWSAGTGFTGPAPKKAANKGMGNIAAIGDMASSFVNDISRPTGGDIKPGQTSVNTGPSTGGMAANGVLKGASAGAKFGPVGAGIGAAVGLIGGIIGGNKERKREERELKQIESVTDKKYQGLNLSANMDPYGSAQTMYMEDGGMVFDENMLLDFSDDTPGKKKKRKGLNNTISNNYGMYSGVVDDGGPTDRPTNIQAQKVMIDYMKNNQSDQAPNPSSIYRPQFQHHSVNMDSLPMVPMAEDGMMVGNEQEGQNVQDEKETIDIELGEILIDPVSLEILREYDNENRFKRHAKNPQFESVGNFTTIEKGQVVISRKYAEKFKKGDSLTRKSIVLQILKEQRNNPQPMVSAPGESVEQAAGGMIVGGPGPKGSILMQTKKLLDGIKGLSDPNLGQTGNYDNYGKTPEFIPNSQDLIPDITDMPGDNATAESPAQTTTGNKAANIIKSIGKKITPTNIARGLNFLPTAYGIATANRDEHVSYDENNQMEKAKSYVEAIETNPSIEAARSNIQTVAAGQTKALNNVNSPSARAEVASRHADVLKATGDLVQNATNFAIESRNKKRSTLADLETAQGNARLNSRSVMRDTLAQNAAKKRQLIQKGLSEGVTNYGTQVMDDNKLRSLNTVLQYYKVGNDGSLNDNQMYGSAVLDIINSGLPIEDTEMELQRKRETEKKTKTGGPAGSSTTKIYVPKKKR